MAERLTRIEIPLTGTKDFTLPMRIVSEANQREHWAVKARRVKAQRHAIALAWYAARLPRGQKPSVVTLTRIALRRLDDDNLAGACKAVRDEVAAMCGFDDRDESVRWVYAQEHGQYGIRVEVTW